MVAGDMSRHDHTRLVIQAIAACQECFVACERCADACLEMNEQVSQMATCIRLCRDCADACMQSVRFLTRNSWFHGNVCAICALICTVCGAECDKHATNPECILCAQVCVRCEQACRLLADLAV